MDAMPESRRKISSWVLDCLPLFLLPLLCLLLYLPALRHDFVMDDATLVVGNPYIKSWRYLPQMLSEDAWNVWERHNYWRPIFSISLALDYSLWGLNPLGFHLTNVLLHALNTVLLYSLSKKLLNTGAVFASLLFALHPIQAHAVNVVSIRGDLLAACFTILALYAFVARKTVAFAVAVLVALLSKETSMVLPVALLFARIFTPRDHRGTKIALAFAILGVYLAIRLSLGFSFFLPPSIFSYDAPWDIRFLLVFKVLLLYFLALFNLFEMPHPFWSVEIPTSLNDPYVIGGMSSLGLLIWAIWKGVKRAPVLAFGLVWFLIYFLPISNLKELNQPMAEHWLYLPMIGLSLAFGAALNTLWIRLSDAHLFRACITAGVTVFLIVGALVVREKTKIYHDDETFLLAAVRANPKIAKLYSIVGSTYLAKQDITKAKEFYAKALALDPNDFLANYRTGFLLQQGSQHEEARIYLERVVRSNPSRLSEILTVAHAWEMLGDKQKALLYYRKALDLNSELVRIQHKVAGLESELQ